MKSQRLRKGIYLIVPSLMILSIALNMTEAQEGPERICLIIVSDAYGYPASEVGKAHAFYDHCISTGYDEEYVILLGPSSLPFSDGDANVSNVEDAFEDLLAMSEMDTEITMYISDHERWIDANISFVFIGGNLLATLIDSWIDQIVCSKVTVILNGERSALAGPILSGQDRDIICSMGAGQYNNPDLFNITRSLKDPTADTDHDGIVDYIEAFIKEVSLLQGSGQDPQIY